MDAAAVVFKFSGYAWPPSGAPLGTILLLTQPGGIGTLWFSEFMTREIGTTVFSIDEVFSRLETLSRLY